MGSMKISEGQVTRAENERLCIEAYGVRIGIESGLPGFVGEVVERLGLLLPNGFARRPFAEAAHVFEVRRDADGVYLLYKNGEKITYGASKEVFLRYLDSLLRLTVAEYAEGKVFIHAGVVAWKGRAIVVPASSFQGKTTLVAELTKLGAVYYSDEYAVLDEDGLVHPFPKTLSVRGIIDDRQQVELPVEHFGGVSGTGPLPVGMILLTEFKPGARWRPRVLSGGQGVMEMLSHTIPIRYNPNFSLKVLNKTVNRAIIVKSKRGDAKDFAIKLLNFFESKALEGISTIIKN
jgi:hypothetical protein